MQPAELVMPLDRIDERKETYFYPTQQVSLRAEANHLRHHV